MNQKETRPDEKSFAELLAESSMKSEHLKPGERVEAEVVNITPDWVYLNMDGKTEGYLSSEEVRDETGNIPLKEGDRISVYFLEAKNGERHFTTRVRGPEAARSFLEQAWQNKTVVEGTVEKAIKGGFLVKLIGGIRGFCPLSQVETARLENPEEYIGRKLDFIVIGYEKKGRNIVLSHRAVLEQEIERKRQALREELREGMTVRGTITSIQKFGAFVDLGGIEGLIPASEVSWSPVEDLHSVLTEGQETEAVVIRLDWDKGRITLSLKEALPGPWTNIEEKYPDGSVHTGQVARLTPFGAFVTLEPGIDGLIRFARKKEGEKPPPLRKIIKEGQSVEVRIESVKKEKRRIILSPILREEPVRRREPGKKPERPPYSPHPSPRPSPKGQPPSVGSLGKLLKEKMKEKKRDR